MNLIDYGLTYRTSYATFIKALGERVDLTTFNITRHCPSRKAKYLIIGLR